MSSHERRNELDEETAAASIEYLVYGKCGVTEHDIGYWDTRWWPLGQLLEKEQVNKSDITAAVEAWQEAEEAARESLQSFSGIKKAGTVGARTVS